MPTDPRTLPLGCVRFEPATSPGGSPAVALLIHVSGAALTLGWTIPDARLALADLGAVVAEMEGAAPPPPITFAYTNWRGERATRRAIPLRVYWGATEWHPEPQWLMEAFDVDKGAVRAFAMADMGPAGALEDATHAAD